MGKLERSDISALLWKAALGKTGQDWAYRQLEMTANPRGSGSKPPRVMILSVGTSTSLLRKEVLEI